MAFDIYENRNNNNFKVIIERRTTALVDHHYREGTLFQGYIYQLEEEQVVTLQKNYHNFDIHHPESQPLQLVMTYYYDYFSELLPNFNLGILIEENCGYTSFAQRVVEDNVKGNLLKMHEDAICADFKEYLVNVIGDRNKMHPEPPQNFT